MDREYLVLSAMGPDKPGIVNQLSGFLYETGANIEDSRMAVLGEQFAVILLASGEHGLEAKLRPRIADIEGHTGLTVSMRASVGRQTSRPGIPCELIAIALDNPGIMHSISHAVARRGANIESLDSSSAPAPLTGAPLFTMRMVCSLPEDVRFATFKAELESVGNELGVDVAVKLLTQ
jgi:glycine cleavage system transcriptional repressor